MDAQGAGAARVTIVLNAVHGGGAEHVGRTWATELRRQGRDCRLVVLERPSDSDLGHVDPGLRFDCVDRRAGWRSWLRLRRELLRDRADVVVSLQMPANLALLLVAATIPRRRRAMLAISERNIVSIAAGRPSLKHRAKVGLAKRVYRHADRVIAISHPVAAEMVAGFGVAHERCVVVPNPVALETGARRGDREVSGPGLGRTAVTLVLAGRISAQKRPFLAVEVACELTDAGVPVTVRVYGDGPLLSDLRDEALRRGVALDHRGWVEDWPAECPEDAVLLLPSVKEGFGNVLVEAASWRIPSVAVSGALGVADAIVPGITGALGVSAQPEALARAVLRAQHCTFQGLDTWLERFSPSASVAVLLEALTDERGEVT